MNNGNPITFSDSLRFMFNQNMVIAVNRLNGEWIKFSFECYEILKRCHDEKLSKEQLDNILYDDKDREYMSKLISNLNVMKGLSIKIERKITNVSLAITHRCNLNCIHCMVNAEYKGEQEIFDTDMICSFLDKIIEINPENIILTGGEPLLRKDFVIILEYLRARFDGKISLMTNGILLNDNNIEAVVNLISNIDISLDGADEDSCAIIRGNGVFEKVVNNIKKLKARKFENISISMVLSNNNSRYVKQFLELNKMLDTKPMLRALSYEGRANENRKDLDERVTRIAETKYNNPQLLKDPRGCTCTGGYDQITIEANGDIFPCNLFVTPDFKMGNINELKYISSVLKLEKGEFVSPCIQQFEPSSFRKCKDCNVNYLCWSCLYPMQYLSHDEFEERCKYKKQLLANVWV